MIPRLRRLVARALRKVRRALPSGAQAANAAGRRAEQVSAWGTAEAEYRRAMLSDFENADHQLRLAFMLDRLGRSNEAKAHALVAIDTTLRARYDARAAHRVHPTFFAARHEMAEFILDHADELAHRIARQMAKKTIDSSGPTKVFVYWDNPQTMPAIVSACRNSIRAFTDEPFELVELDDSNLHEYVTIDPAVRTKLLGKPAHFSDYLRSKLLQEHGGMWLDSTCLLTRPLSEVTTAIQAKDVFLFTYAGSRVGSWFFVASPTSYVLNAIAETEALWWERNSHLTNYFMWHDIVEMLYWTDPQYADAWDAMEKVHPRNALGLLGVLDHPFNDDRYTELLASSGVHKLTHKLPAEVFKEDTFAGRICLAQAPRADASQERKT